MELFDLLCQLSQVHGPSGDEAEIRNLIAGLVKPFADEIREDNLGNLIVRKKGTGAKVMFAAHMDSIGFIVTHIEKEGFLRVGRIGGIGPKEAVYTPVQFKNGIKGVIVPEEKAEFGKLKLDECYIDIGAKDAEEAKAMVQVGDTAVYDSPRFKNGCKAVIPYMDNRVACAILIAALEQMKENDNDVYFVFTTQEEVGLRGAKTAAYEVDPDYGIAVDVTDVDDTPGSEKNGTVRLGKGAAVKLMDSSVICHPEVIKLLEDVAKEKEIQTQRDILRGGGTDAGVIHVTRMGVRTGGISIPCRYVHSPVEMVDLFDVEHCVKLVAEFAQMKLNKL